MAYSSSIPSRMNRKLTEDFKLFEQIFVENDSADEEDDNRFRLDENAKAKDIKMRIFHPEAFAPLNKEIGSVLEKSMKESAAKSDLANGNRRSRPPTSISGDLRPDTAMTSASGTSTRTAGGRQKALTVHAAEEVRVLVWTTEHVMLLYIISLFSSADSKTGTSTWIRASCLHVILFEMINQQIVDMDYSPVRFKLSDGFQQHPVVWNISQEAEEILRDLFYNKFITVLRAMSKDLTISLFFQINEAGSLLLKHVPQGLLSDCHRVLYETLPDGSLSNLLHVKLEPREQKIVSLDASKSVPTVADVKFRSLIHVIEDVSYKSKPSFFKQSEKQRKYVASEKQSLFEFDVSSNMLDEDLHENMALKDVIIQVVDWVPTGSNQHRQLAAEIGAGERCRESYANVPKPGEPHVQIDILEYATDAFVHIVAELNDEDDSGIAQIETFGLRIQSDGMVTSGLELYDAGGLEGKKISLDLLARIYADMEQDSTGVVQSVISRTQKLMVEVLWGDSWKFRPTYRIIVCKDIEPKIPAKYIINDSSMTSEIAQVIGKVFGAFDYSRGVIVIGNSGVLMSGINHAKGASPEVLAFVRYGSLIIASKQLFSQIEAAEVSIFDLLNKTNSRKPYYVSGAHNQHHVLAARNRQIRILLVIGLLLKDAVESITRDTMHEVNIDPASPFDIVLSIRILRPCVDDCLRRLDVSKSLSKFSFQTTYAANQLRFIDALTTVVKSLRYMGQLIGVDRKKAAVTTSIKAIVWHRLALHVADRINIRKNSHHFQLLVDRLHSATAFLMGIKGFEAVLWSLAFLMVGIFWFFRETPTKSENFSWKFSGVFLNMENVEKFLRCKQPKKVFVESIRNQGSLTKVEYQDFNVNRWKSSKVVIFLAIDSNGFLFSASVKLTRKFGTLQLSAESVKQMLFHQLESDGLKNNDTFQDFQRKLEEREKSATSASVSRAKSLFDDELAEIQRKIEQYNLLESGAITGKV